MDNLSHAFSGLLIGELIHRSLPREDEEGNDTTRRRLLLTTGVLAASFPDLDLVLTPLLPEPLGYLLHHRGHTHTYLYALPQAVLLAGLLALLWPKARCLLAKSRAAMAGFGMTLITGFVSHILMDSLNSYGIHPFFPFDPNWYYGDMVFIIEPVFWVAFGVPLIMMIHPLWLRWLLLTALTGTIVYFTWQGFLLGSSLALMLGIGAVLALLQWRAGSRRITGLLGGMTVCLGFIFVQAVTSAEASRMVYERLQANGAEVRVLDAAMTPFPANPVCWMFASIEQSGDEYRARRGVLSLMPELLGVAACPEPFAQIPVDQRDKDRAFVLVFTHAAARSGLQRLYEQDCHFRAWMRFARIPAHADRRAWDTRFDRTGDNFTLIDLASMAQEACPRHVPQWGVPRTDLLQSGQAMPGQYARRE